MSLQYSDEIVNAFIDGELGGFEKEEFKQAMAQDKVLFDRVSCACELKKTVQMGYSAIPDPVNPAHSMAALKYKNLRPFGAAAVIFLALGVFVGWVLHGNVNNEMVVPVLTESTPAMTSMPVVMPQTNKIVLHVASSDPDKLRQTMDKIESILEQHQSNNQPFELEVVANSSGIDLLRKDISPYRDRIEQIISMRKPVSFIACSNALERLKDKGIRPDLIAETKTGVTAVEQIVKRLQQGWVYVRV